MASSGEAAGSGFEGFERAGGETQITVGRLLIEMAQADESMGVLASDDEEGNDFRPIERVAQGLYLPQQTWFGYFHEHPDRQATMDARMLYERIVKDQEGSVEATLLASVDPDAFVETMMSWGDLRSELADTDPDSIVILRHHTRVTIADYPPSFSPLQEVETAHYLQDRGIAVNVGGFDAKIPAERFTAQDEYEDEEEREFVEESLKDPNARRAYFFWPLN